MDRGWTFAFQAVNFLALVWLLQRFLYRPVQRTIAERQRRAEQAAAQIREAQGSVDQARAAIDHERTEAAAERERVLVEAHGRARVEHDAAVARARTAADELLAAARRTLADERAQALAGLQARAAELGTAIAARLLRELAPAAGLALDDAFLAKITDYLDRLPRERLRMLAADSRSGVQVITAHDLAPAAVARWTAELAGRLGAPPAVAFHTDAGLIAGAELRLGSAVVKFSWRDALGQARDLVEDHAIAG